MRTSHWTPIDIKNGEAFVVVRAHWLQPMLPMLEYGTVKCIPLMHHWSLLHLIFDYNQCLLYFSDNQWQSMAVDNMFVPFYGSTFFIFGQCHNRFINDTS